MASKQHPHASKGKQEVKQRKANKPNRGPKTKTTMTSRDISALEGNLGIATRTRPKPQSFDEWHKSVNPYYAVLADPISASNVRIPDMTTMPSATFRVVGKTLMSASANGVCAFTFGGNGVSAATTNTAGLAQQSMMIPTGVYYSAGGPATQSGNHYAAGWVTNQSGGADDSDIFKGGAVPFVFQGWDSATDSVPNIFGNVRLVSACLIVEPVGSMTNSSGRMIGASLPRIATLRDGNTAATSSGYIENKPDTYSIAVNRCTPITVRYCPQDDKSLCYAPLSRASAPGNRGMLTFTALQQQAAGAAVALYTPPGGFSTEDDLIAHSPGELWVVCTGCTAAQPFQVTIVANYEAIPWQQSTMLASTSVSKSDPVGLAHAHNAMADAPKVMQGNTSVPPAAITHHHADPKPTMMENIVKGIRSTASVVRKLAPPALALLSAI